MNTANESLSTHDFDRLRTLIRLETGISLSAEKKTMLEIRVKRRLRQLAQFGSFADYCEYVFTAAGREKELTGLIDAVTTNKTDFFREPDHFDYLLSKALPELDARREANRQCLVWSAGCSTGEEPYTLAMLLNEYAEGHRGFRFRVLASDISTEVLSKASHGIFKAEVTRPVPRNLHLKYLMRGRDANAGLVRVVPELRARVEFRRLNLMDVNYGLGEQPEVIFCRNVIIYFDRPTQTRLIEKLTRSLAPGGYLFAGHSECLQSMDVPLTAAGPSVYRKRET